MDGLACAAVRALFWPLSCRHFIDEYWEARHFAIRKSPMLRAAGSATGFSSALRKQDLGVMAQHWSFSIRPKDHAQVVVLLPNSFSHHPGWPDATPIRADGFERALADNCTVVLHNVELYWRPVAAISRALHAHFGLYSQANVYYSPGGLPQAVHAHQDAQSVFIVQCEGRKRWELFSPPQVS